MSSYRLAHLAAFRPGAEPDCRHNMRSYANEVLQHLIFWTAVDTAWSEQALRVQGYGSAAQPGYGGGAYSAPSQYSGAATAIGTQQGGWQPPLPAAQYSAAPPAQVQIWTWFLHQPSMTSSAELRIPYAPANGAY